MTDSITKITPLLSSIHLGSICAVPSRNPPSLSRVPVSFANQLQINLKTPKHFNPIIATRQETYSQNTPVVLTNAPKQPLPSPCEKLSAKLIEFLKNLNQRISSCYFAHIHRPLFRPGKPVFEKSVKLLSVPAIEKSFARGLDKTDPTITQKKEAPTHILPLASQAKSIAIRIALLATTLLLPPCVNIPTFYWITRLQERKLNEIYATPKDAQSATASQAVDLKTHLTEELQAEKRLLFGSILVITTIISFCIPQLWIFHILLRLPLLILSLASDDCIKKITSSKLFQKIFQFVNPLIENVEEALRGFFIYLYQNYFVPYFKNFVINFLDTVILKPVNCLYKTYLEPRLKALQKNLAVSIASLISKVACIKGSEKMGELIGASAKKGYEKVAKDLENSLSYFAKVFVNFFFQKLVSVTLVKQFASAFPALSCVNSLISIFSLLLPEKETSPLFPGILATLFYLLTGSFLISGIFKVIYSTILEMTNKYNISIIDDILFPKKKSENLKEKTT